MFLPHATLQGELVGPPLPGLCCLEQAASRICATVKRTDGGGSSALERTALEAIPSPPLKLDVASYMAQDNCKGGWECRGETCGHLESTSVFHQK